MSGQESFLRFSFESPQPVTQIGTEGRGNAPCTLLPETAKPSFLENTDPSLDNRGLLHALFETSAERYAERVAIECQSQTLGYAEVEKQANQFARFLRKSGIENGQRIGLLLPKSFDLYIAILGVLKAGASYIPIDPSYPVDRVRFIASDSDAALIVSSLEHLDLVGKLEIPKLFVNEARHEIEKQSVKPLPAEISPEDEAYVIYTSGSTGQPKGVSISHGNACHFALAEQKAFAIRCEDRILQGFSVAFDASVEEIWLAFQSGATLVAGTPEIMHSGPDLARNLADLGI
ncbi:MAG: AMP-binding protein, partial [Methylococcaceae bacterium]|nr:AMP-binding protein [Methylococcaceae bacterium]